MSLGYACSAQLRGDRYRGPAGEKVGSEVFTAAVLGLGQPGSERQDSRPDQHASHSRDRYDE